MSTDCSTFFKTAGKYIAARNALVAKHTYEVLGEDQQQRVDEQIIDMLIAYGIRASRAPRYKALLRETQYYGMAALAMALLGIPPALPGILFRERWEHVQNPLTALTGAETEIQMAAKEILRKNSAVVTLSDEDKQVFKWERVLPGERCPRNMN